MFANLAKKFGRQAAPSGRARDLRPSLDVLEGRELMAIGPELFFPVNTTTRNAQFDSDTATNAGGTSVVAWVDTFSPTDHDIRAQRFNAFGTKIGPEIVVSFSGLDESSPAVAIDDQGRFVVTWVQRLAGGDTNVVAQRFDANGIAMGGVIQVGAGTFRESAPDVAMDISGNFVVSYTRNTNNNNPDVFAKRYNNAGTLLNVVNVAVGPKAETNSSIAMTPDGRFAVAWQEAFSPTDQDIKLGRFTAAGASLGVTGI